MRQYLPTALLALLLVSSAARATTFQVTVHNFEFSPATVDIQVGDTVMWTNASGFHSVTSDDGTSFSNTAGSGWTFSHTFNAAGSFPYHCEVHPSLMQGTVNVSGGGGGGDQHGTLKLELASYAVNEGDSVDVRVLRLNGDDGPVSVSYSVAAGTASASDFTAASGTLSWADGDDTPRSLTVATTEDSAVEGNETVKVTLSNATGGATIDGTGKSATVTIQDDDSGGPPGAPTNLQGHAHSTTEVMLTWTDANGETSYRIEMKTLTGAFQQVATAGQNVTSAIVGGLNPATAYIFRVRAENGAGNSAFSNEARVTTDGPVAPCVPTSTALCLNNGRFQVEVSWSTGDQSGDATAVPLDFAPDSGLFYFFSQSNVEMLVKVLNACVPALGNKYWVFYAATTNVELTMTVVDTHTGKTQVYFNPRGTAAAPVQDTNAFATCP